MMPVDSEGNELRIGDRVIVVDEDGLDGYRPTIGASGTIKFVQEDDWVGVEFDVNVEGHDLHGLTKYGYGYFGSGRSLLLLSENQDVKIVITIDDVLGLIQ